MKYLHFMRDANQGGKFLNFINDNYTEEEHYFIIFAKSLDEFNIKNERNCLRVFKDNIFKKVRNVLQKMTLSEKIYVHSLRPFDMIFLLINFKCLKKTNWIIWGGDLYEHVLRVRTLKNFCYEIMRRVLIKRLGYISTQVKGDYELATQWYGAKAEYVKLMYPSPLGYEYYDKLKADKGEQDILNIQIGNSADSTNNHCEMIEAMHNFASENIKVYCPLSYGGDLKYKELVIRCGKEKLGAKFVPLLDFMPADEYGKYLNSIDIALFNHDRQQALGNIYALLYLGKKVYIKSSITSWDHLIEDVGVKVFDIDNIKNKSFEEFLEYYDAELNEQNVKKIVDRQYAYELWKKEFEQV